MQLRPENRKKDPLKQWHNLMALFIHYDIYFKFLIHLLIKLKQTICGNPLTFPLTFDL
jgi:hypothetical protein